MKKHSLLGDFIQKMGLATFLYSMSEIINGVLSVYIADKIGDISNDLFESGSNIKLEEVIAVAVGTILLTVMVPFVRWLGENNLFKQSFPYCNTVMDAFLNNRYENVKKIGKGEAEYRLEDDTISFYCTMESYGQELISLPVIIAYMIYKLGDVNAVFLIGAFLLAAISFFVPLLFRKKQEEYYDKVYEYKARLRQDEISLADEAESYVFLGILRAWIDRIKAFYEKNIPMLSRWNRLRGVVDGASALLMVAEVVVVVTGAVLSGYGIVDIGEVAGVVILLPLYKLIVEKIYKMIKDIPNFKVLKSRMKAIYSGLEKENGDEISEIFSVDVKDFAVLYDEKDAYTNTVSFSLKKGERVVIKGVNGSGKTSVLNGLVGLIADYKGEIFIDGRELRELSVKSLRSKIAYAPQNPTFLRGTIFENIRLSDKKISDDEIIEYLKLFKMEHLLNRTEDISADELSGGEKQKISLIRTILKHGDILILDEPTNQLDSESIRILIDVLNGLICMMIIVTHDSRMILERADELVIGNGYA
ncbi:MAG: ATP-binding cassette domain-containing protein [Acetatifactor sp.]|nr:ATP-binding cassette domain-containing protein [Acetatifactor sp.]